MSSVLSLIRPRQRSTGQQIDLRVSSASAESATGLGGFFWEPAINKAPRASLELMGLDLAAGLLVATCTMTLNLDQIKDVDANDLLWSGAPVVIYRADGVDLASAPVEFVGRVKTPAIDLLQQKVALTIEVSVQDIDVPLLYKRFNGGGGINGMAELRGTLVPAGFGRCQNIEPVMFDTTRNIAMVDGYDNTIEIDWLGEGLSSLGASVGDYPTYAALAAAIDAGSIPRGRWATCVTSGLIGLGAPVAGRLSAHATFGAGLPGAMMLRALRTHAMLSDAVIEFSSFAEIDAQVARKTHFWTADQRTVKDLCEKVAQSCNATFIATMQSTYAVTRVVGGPAVGRLVRGGFSEPAVTAWSSLDVLDPVWRIRARVARPGVVFTRNEVLYADTFTARGLYSPTETYRQGDTVFLADRSEWLFTNVTPSAGHAPPDAPVEEDGYWFRLQPPMTAEDLRYGDGTVMEDLQPKTAGADATKPALGDVYRSGQPIVVDFSYTKGDIVRDQGADWIFISDAMWDGTMPPDLPTEMNAWWRVVKDAVSYALSVLPPSFDFKADYTGALSPGQLPAGFLPTFTIGGVDVSDDVAWSVTASGASVSALDTDGSGDITAVSSAGVLVITGMINDVSKVVRIPISVSRDGSPSGGGQSSTVTGINGVSGSSYPASPSETAVVSTGSGTSISFTGSFSYGAVASNKVTREVTVAAKIVYRVSGSAAAWTDAFAEVIGSTAESQGYPEYSDTPGELSFGPISVTGLMTGTNYEFGILARRTAGNSSTAPSGYATGVGG